MENPLTAAKARQIAEWLVVCDTFVVALIDRGYPPEMSEEQMADAREFFSGHEMQQDLKGYADWADAVSLRAPQ